MGRPPKACLNCQKRKIKCDLKKPACQPCVGRGLVCTGYPPPQFRMIPVPASGQLERNEQSSGLMSLNRSQRKDAQSAGKSGALLPHSQSRFLVISPQRPLNRAEPGLDHLKIFTGASHRSRADMKDVFIPQMMTTSEACKSTFLFVNCAHSDMMNGVRRPAKEVMMLKEQCFRQIRLEWNGGKFSAALGFAIANLAGACFLYDLPDDLIQYNRHQEGLQLLIQEGGGPAGLMRGSDLELKLLKVVVLNQTFFSMIFGVPESSLFKDCDSWAQWPQPQPGNTRESPLYCTQNFASLEKVASGSLLGLLHLARQCLDCLRTDMSVDLDSYNSYQDQIQKLPKKPDAEYEAVRVSMLIILHALATNTNLVEAGTKSNRLPELRQCLERTDLRRCWSEEKIGVLWWVLTVGSVASYADDQNRPYFWSWLQYITLQFLGNQEDWWSLIVPIRRMIDVAKLAQHGLV